MRYDEQPKRNKKLAACFFKPKLQIQEKLRKAFVKWTWQNQNTYGFMCASKANLEPNPSTSSLSVCLGIFSLVSATNQKHNNLEEKHFSMQYSLKNYELVSNFRLFFSSRVREHNNSKFH